MSEKRTVKMEYSSRLGHVLMWLIILALFFWFIDAISPILLPFIIGALMAYLFDPMADRMEKRMPRAAASAIITLGFFSLLVALLIWLGPKLYAQLSDLVDKLPALVRDIDRLVRSEVTPVFDAIQKLSNGQAQEYLPSNVSEVMERAFAMSGQVLLGVLASSGAVLNVLALLLITPIVSFYLLRDWDIVMAKFNKLLPRAYAPIIRGQAREINGALAGYLRGQLYVMFLLSVYFVLLLSVIGLKYSLILGVIAGFLVIVPYIGTWVSVALALIVAYGQFGVGTAFWAVVAIFAVGQVLESQILTPKIVGDNIGVHPLWLLFSMLAGGVLLGAVGVLLAVPITAVLGVLVRFAVSVYLESPLYKEK